MLMQKKMENSSYPKLITIDKWLRKRQKSACLRIPHLTPARGDDYYYSINVLFKTLSNSTLAG